MSAVEFSPVDHRGGETQRTRVDGRSSGRGQVRTDTQRQPAPAVLSPVDPISGSDPIHGSGRLADSLLLIYSDALDDLEGVRIATENRVRALRQVKDMEGTPEEARLVAMVDSLRALEHGAELELKRGLRNHPLGPWVKRTIGIGEKQGARLLAAIGNPADRKTVSQLWAYCGYHVLHPGQSTGDTQMIVAGVDPSDTTDHRTAATHTRNVGGVAPRLARGQHANWNGTARMRAFLCAESCIKKRHSPYRPVYDAGRAKYAEAVHSAPCPQCGPKGKPALPGSPLSDGHKHARALRLVAKAILRDLWIEARRIEENA